MATAVLLSEYGGPRVLKIEHVDVAAPGPGELRVRQTAIGVNFHDVYVRSGLYKTLALPGIPGIEAAGVVEAIGPQVTGFSTGDSIAYITNHYGAYASERILPARLAIRLPDGIDQDLAASVLLKGLTAQMLLRQVHQVQPGDTILVHAASGGVGQLLCQWASYLGATVIGTVGSDEKAERARAMGCAHTILYREENFVERVRQITNNQGVNVVYDSVGKDTFLGSLAALARRGHLVNFGQSSGSIDPIEVSILAPKSNSLTRPGVFHYTAERAMLESMAGELFTLIERDVLAVQTGQIYPLAEVAHAHQALESRSRMGTLLLKP